MVLGSISSTLSALNNYSNNNKMLNKSLEKLSSGYNINSASDDPSGLAISEKLKTQANSLSQGIQNANSAISLIQIADKAMKEQSNIIDIVKSKLIQASTDTTNEEGREALRKDIVKLLEQFDNIAKQTNYNGKTLLQSSSSDFSSSQTLSFQIGEHSSDIIVLDSIQANTKGINLEDLKNLSENELTSDLARSYLDDTDVALSKLNSFRSTFGSTQNQLESSVNYMISAKTNLLNSQSIIKDTDYAEEANNVNKYKLYVQASIFTLNAINEGKGAFTQLLFKY